MIKTFLIDSIFGIFQIHLNAFNKALFVDQMSAVLQKARAHASGYPIIDVEKTTSPETFLVAPKPWPMKHMPSSNTSAALFSFWRKFAPKVLDLLSP
jgi:hypothetical protein